MIKKIKVIFKISKLIKKIKNLVNENKKDFEELFNLAIAKVKKISPEIAEIIAEIKNLF